MDEKTITISLREYKDLFEALIRIDIFADFVNKNNYSIEREDCGKFLGFDVVKMED